MKARSCATSCPGGVAGLSRSRAPRLQSRRPPRQQIQARIKILTHEMGIEAFRAEVEKEFAKSAALGDRSGFAAISGSSSASPVSSRADYERFQYVAQARSGAGRRCGLAVSSSTISSATAKGLCGLTISLKPPRRAWRRKFRADAAHCRSRGKIFVGRSARHPCAEYRAAPCAARRRPKFSTPCAGVAGHCDVG